MRNRAVWSWLIGLGVLLVAAAVLATGISQAEEHDPFCIGCHTTPEQTYFDRAQAALTHPPSADLASVHYELASEPFRCINCHRGSNSLPDRATTLVLGASDAIALLTGRADPAIEKGLSALPALENKACLNCHTETLAIAGFNNHFHNKLAAAQRDGDVVTSTLGCSDCHNAHIPVAGGHAEVFLDVHGVVYPACVTCHTEMGEGPLELVR
jgi:hypothetical protein